VIIIFYLWKSIFLTKTASDCDSAWDSELPAWDSITTILVWDWLKSYLQLILSKRIIIFYLSKSIFLTKTASDFVSAWDSKIASDCDSAWDSEFYFGLRLTTVKNLAPISHLMSTVAEIVFGLGYSPYSWYPGTCIALYLRSLRFNFPPFQPRLCNK